jgi:hypothetical protein
MGESASDVRVECQQRASRGDADKVQGARSCTAGEVSVDIESLRVGRVLPCQRSAVQCSSVQSLPIAMVLHSVLRTKTRLSGADERKRGQLVNTGRVKELCCRR